MRSLINFIYESVSSKEDKFIKQIIDCIPDNIKKFDESFYNKMKQVCASSDCCTDIEKIDLEYEEDNKPICSIIFYEESKYDWPVVMFAVHIPYKELGAYADYPLTLTTSSDEYDPYDDREVTGKIDCPSINITLSDKKYFKLTEDGHGSEYLISEDTMKKLLRTLGNERKEFKKFLPNIEGTKVIKDWWNKN